MDIVHAAIEGGNAHVLEWAWDKSPPSVWQQEAEAGSQAGLQWLVAHYLPCSYSAWQTLSDGGIREIVQQAQMWQAIEAHPQLPNPQVLARIPITAYSCRQAARVGSLELLVWLKGQGCPWDGRACNMAARYGHLGVLQWLRDHPAPCPWSAHTTLLAAQHDQPHVLSWLLQQDPACPLTKQPERASDRCLEILVQLRCTLTPAARAHARALGFLSTATVLGLARWRRQQSSQTPAAKPGSRVHFTSGHDGWRLLTEFSQLPDDVIAEICVKAGMFRPD